MRQFFTPPQINPIQVLQQLIPRQENEFKFNLISVEGTLQLFKDLQPTNATGHDAITMNVLKKISKQISPHLTHLINRIIITATFPSTFKISKITPQLKPEKNPYIIDSYRPIHNMASLEKVVEHYIKQQLTSHFEHNKIINTQLTD